MRIEILPLMLVLALTTYLFRTVPTVLFHRKLKSRFAISFFHYIPYAVLTAMLIPGAFYSTGNVVTAVCGIAVGAAVAYFGGSLMVVSLVSCLVAFLVGLIPF